MDKIKNALWCVVCAVVMAVLPASCAKAPIDRDIEGFWRLDSYVTVSDGHVHHCERIFYGITRYVVEVGERQGPGGYGTFIGRFEYVDGSSVVAMRDFRQRASTSDNGVPATADDLRPFGMDSTSTVFRVVDADGSRLVLQSDYARLELTRF